MSIEARIKDIQIQPLKGGSPLSLTEARMRESGLETVDGQILDHSHFVVDATTDIHGDHNFLTQRVQINPGNHLYVEGTPQLAKVKPEKRGETLVYHFGTEEISAPHPQEDDLSRVLPIQIWEYRGKAIEIPILSEWLSDQIKRRVLVARTSGPWDRLNRQNFEVNDKPIRAQDGYSLHIITWADVQAVFGAIGVKPDANRFRYQILLDDVPLREIHEYEVAYVNGIEIHLPKPCGRCEVTGIDQEKGEFSTIKPLAGLARLKLPRWEQDEKQKHHIMGENAFAMGTTIIKRGDIFSLSTPRAVPLRFEQKN